MRYSFHQGVLNAPIMLIGYLTLISIACSSNVPHSKIIPQMSSLPFDLYCVQKPVGFYQTGYYSRLYITCENDRVTHFLCSEGFVFDGDSNKCIVRPKLDNQTEIFTNRFEGILQATQFCAKQADGFYNFASKCTASFFRCFNSEPKFYICPLIKNGNGLVEETYWHPYIGKCTRKSYVPGCDDGNILRMSDQIKLFAKPFCTDKSGLKAVGDCRNTIISCEKDKINIRSCPKDLVFDGKETCIADKVCHDQIQRRLNDKCAELGNGIHRTFECSNKFLECRDGIGYLGYCSSDESYDRLVGKCRKMSEVPWCKSNVNPTLTVRDNLCANGKNGGYFPHRSNCRKFIQCAHGNEVEKDCPDKTAWHHSITACDHLRNVPHCN